MSGPFGFTPKTDGGSISIEDVKIKGDTDDTLIGNYRDRLKTETYPNIFLLRQFEMMIAQQQETNRLLRLILDDDEDIPLEDEIRIEL